MSEFTATSQSCLAIMWRFLSICCSQDGGLFQRSNHCDVDLLSKQNTSTYKNNSKSHTVTDITSFLFYFYYLHKKDSEMNNLSFTVSRFTLTSIFLESFWALLNFMTQNIGQHDYKFWATWLWFRATWLRVRWLSCDLTVIRDDDRSDRRPHFRCHFVKNFFFCRLKLLSFFCKIPLSVHLCLQGACSEIPQVCTERI